ncbi:MAG: RDD family protein [bacterium]|nr:RDD family protein [bacterium]
MKENNFAGFKLRLLARLTDGGIILLPHSLFWLYISTSVDIPEFISRLFLYIELVFLPLLVFGFLYHSLLTVWWGGSLGKLITGLQVIGENGGRLTLKRSIFRYTVGYSFSAVFLGLGFLAVIKDPQKQAFHDKAIGSKVIEVRKWWPLTIISSVVLFTIFGFLMSSSVINLAKGPLGKQFLNYIQNVQKESLKEETPTGKNPVEVIPLPTNVPQKARVPQINVSTPKGGEKFKEGQLTTIRWQLVNPPTDINNWQVIGSLVSNKIGGSSNTGDQIFKHSLEEDNGSFLWKIPPSGLENTSSQVFAVIVCLVRNGSESAFARGAWADLTGKGGVFCNQKWNWFRITGD